MTYEYELVINGVVRTRDSAEFRPNIITMGVEDLLKVNSKIDLFEIRIKKLNNWKDRQKPIIFKV